MLPVAPIILCHAHPPIYDNAVIQLISCSRINIFILSLHLILEPANLYEFGNKRPSVDRCRTKLLERRDMRRSSVSFMLRETILRIIFIVLLHHMVPGHLCEDAGCRDRNALRVALDDRHLGIATPGIVTASFKRTCGTGSSFEMACRIAS